MSGLDPKVVVYHLEFYIEEKIVKDKLRKIHPHIEIFIKIELQKVLGVQFI
jgi:hypothetical protein